MTIDKHASELVQDGLMRVDEAARFLGISRGSLYNLMGGGLLPFVKIGRSRRIPRRAVVDLAASSLRGECVKGESPKLVQEASS